MNIFDIIGPVMVGPSSSHTAGAVRIGYISGKLLGEPVKKAAILLYGSFLATGKGHGTQKALVAGLLGMVKRRMAKNIYDNDYTEPAYVNNILKRLFDGCTFGTAWVSAV